MFVHQLLSLGGAGKVNVTAKENMRCRLSTLFYFNLHNKSKRGDTLLLGFHLPFDAGSRLLATNNKVKSSGRNPRCPSDFRYGPCLAIIRIVWM